MEKKVQPSQQDIKSFVAQAKKDRSLIRELLKKSKHK